MSNDQAPASLDAPNPTDASRNRSDHFEIKEEYIHSSDQSFPLSYDKISGPAAYQSIQNSHTTDNDNVECAGDRSKLIGKGQQVCLVIFNGSPL